ncbi:MAG TPA: YciI family protein [Terriglobales bacterium]|nr:YciI family protein [Terriglobales bacterium]
MKVMVFVKANPISESGALPPTEALAAMQNFNESLVKAGVMLAAEGLRPSSHGVRVKFVGPEPTVIPGPFPETKDLIAGFWMWQVPSLDDAIAWLKRAPFGGGVEIELRPIFESEDFGASLTPELRAQNQRLREEMARRNTL